MQTFTDVIKKYKNLLSTVNPVRDIRVLLGHIEKREADFYFMHPETFISEDVVVELDKLIHRLRNNEPLSKIIEKREFYGRMFKVTNDTLDPRQDTETLIDAVLTYKDTLPKPLIILDLGVGTGCILLTLLAELQGAKGVGVDISEKALDVARHNAKTLGLEGHATFKPSNWFDGILDDEKFALIVSNPPYIRNHEILEPNVYDFDPHTALFAGNDGLDAYKVIAKDAKKHLLPRGKLIVEFGRGQEKAVVNILELNGFKHLESFHDLSGMIRCAIFA